MFTALNWNQLPVLSKKNLCIFFVSPQIALFLRKMGSFIVKKHRYVQDFDAFP